MTKLLGFHGVEAEKAEAMRRYNNRRIFSNILQATVVALLCYLSFPTLDISLQITGDWFNRTGTGIITNRFVLFVFTNILVALIFLLSSNGNDESNSSNTEPDLYDQYTSSSSSAVKDIDSNKQMVVKANRDVVTTDGKKRFSRTTKKKKNSVTVREFRRTESARVKEDEWGLSSEEFRLKAERFIMEQKKSIRQQNDDVVQCQELTLLRASYGYSSC